VIGCVIAVPHFFPHENKKNTFTGDRIVKDSFLSGKTKYVCTHLGKEDGLFFKQSADYERFSKAMTSAEDSRCAVNVWFQLYDGASFTEKRQKEAKFTNAKWQVITGPQNPTSPMNDGSGINVFSTYPVEYNSFRAFVASKSVEYLTTAFKAAITMQGMVYTKLKTDKGSLHIVNFEFMKSAFEPILGDGFADITAYKKACDDATEMFTSNVDWIFDEISPRYDQKTDSIMVVGDIPFVQSKHADQNQNMKQKILESLNERLSVVMGVKEELAGTVDDESRHLVFTQTSARHVSTSVKANSSKDGAEFNQIKLKRNPGEH
jgi:hypothetical protein